MDEWMLMPLDVDAYGCRCLWILMPMDVDAYGY